MRTKTTEIPAIDYYPLAATILEPETEIKGVIQFHTGTAIKKEFYFQFCKFLAENGYVVVMFDYRGVGGSSPESLIDFKAYMREWATLDMAGVLQWIVENYPDYPRFIVAHSMGGQIVGLMENHSLIDGYVGLAISTGYWRYLPFPYRYFCAFLWYIYIPITTSIFKYGFAKKLGFSEDLPAGVAIEWGDWCKSKNYISSFYGKTIDQHFFDEISFPMKVFVTEDDEIATKRSVPHMLEYYKNTDVDLEWISLESINAKEVGHFGYFSRKYRDSIWQNVIKWIDSEVSNIKAS